MRQAWVVGVLAGCQHGQRVTSIFTLSETKAAAISNGVSVSLQNHDCPTTAILTSFANRIEAEVIHAAAEELARSEEDLR